MSLSILCFNINGLEKDPKSIADYYFFSTQDVDVICLIETHCTINKTNELFTWTEWKGSDATIKNYKMSGGIALYAKRNIKLDILEVGKRHV